MPNSLKYFIVIISHNFTFSVTGEKYKKVLNNHNPLRINGYECSIGSMDLNVLGPGPHETYLPYIPIRRENSLLPELRLYKKMANGSSVESFCLFMGGRVWEPQDDAETNILNTFDEDTGTCIIKLVIF